MTRTIAGSTETATVTWQAMSVIAGATETLAVTWQPFSTASAGSETIGGEIISSNGSSTFSAAQVAQAASGISIAGLTVTHAPIGWNVGSPSGSTTVFTSTSANQVVAAPTDQSSSGSAATAPSATVTTTGRAAVNGGTETIGGMTITGNAAFTAAQVAQVAGGVTISGLAVTTAPTLWTVSAASGATNLFTGTSPSSVQPAPTAGSFTGSAAAPNSVVTTVGTASFVGPAVTSMTVPADATYGTGQALNFTTIFNELVTVTTTSGTPRIALTLDTGATVYANYVSGSGTNTLTFRYTVASGTQDLTGITNATSIDLNGGAIKDSAGATADPTISGVEPTTTGVLVDAIVPIVTSVGVPANGTYIAGQSLDFTVNLSKAVTVNTSAGTPTIALTLGNGVIVQAAYLSGSGTSALVFRYTVATGNVDNDGIIVGSAITLNSGTITDSLGNPANATLANIGSTVGVLVDAVPPTVSAIVRAGSTPNNGSTDQYTVTFSKNVTGVDVNDFNLTNTGTAAGTITSVTGVGAVYTVTVSNVTGDGTIRLDLNGSGTGITDIAANPIAAGYTGGQSYTIDHTVPAAPILTGLGTNSDTGVSTTDRITNLTAPSVTGTAEAGSTVTLYDTNGTTVLGSVTTTSGTFTITPTIALAAGVHSLTATATDAAGNVSTAAASLSVTIDTTAPTAPTLTLLPASDSGVSSTDGITNVTTPTFTGTAEPGSTVTLYDTNGTSVLGTAIANIVGGAYTITASTLSAGMHSLKAKAVDVAGNVSVASSVLGVTIDATAPSTPTLTLSAASDTGVSATDHITSVTTPVLTGTTAAGAIVTLYDANGATVLASTTANATTGAFSFTTPTLAAGVHNLTVKASDIAGNVSAASAVLSVTVDFTAPVATITTPAATNLAAVQTISGTAGTGDVGSVVTLKQNGYLAGVTTVQSGGTWSASVTLGNIGPDNVVATVTDPAGNIGTTNIMQYTVAPPVTQPLFGTAVHDVTSLDAAIYALYLGILGRTPDAMGYEAWSTLLGEGVSTAFMAQTLLSSFEYIANAGISQTNPSFVNQLYLNTIGRAADAGGLAYWDSVLASGVSRAQVAVTLATSAEAQNNFAPIFASGVGVFVSSETTSEIARVYYSVLDRAPDAAGLTSWVQASAHGVTLSTIAATFLASAEYASSFGAVTNAAFITDVFQNALGRAPETAGAQSWLAALSAGASRASVVVSIAESAEATSYLSSKIETGYKTI